MAKAPISAIPHIFYIRPAPGWLEILQKEVEAIVSSPLQKYKFEPKVTLLHGTVKLQRCDFRQGLEVLLRMTTAHDVEWMLMESKCNSWPEVDAILRRVPWDEVLPQAPLPVHVAAEAKSAFTTASARLRERLSAIASVEHVSEGEERRLKIDLRGERLRVSISLAGAPLYQRGYKALLTAVAPLPEHHAAACIRWILAGAGDFSSLRTILVPFAGSGTLGFEAVNVLTQTGAGAFKRSFDVDKFSCCPTATMEFLRRKTRERLAAAEGYSVWLNDFHTEAVASLKANIAAFESPARFEIVEGDAFEWKPELPAEGDVLALLNPPYGDRLGDEAGMEKFYSRLGIYLRNLSKRLPGRLIAGCLCPDELTWRALLYELRLKTPETHHFTHGGKDMRLVRWRA